MTTTAMQTEFLYTGVTPVQSGVVLGTIDETRASAVSGVVFDRDRGAPLSGVTVTVLGRPEFGSTMTEVDGAYRMVVNGGSHVTLDFELDDFFSGRRQVYVPRSCGWERARERLSRAACSRSWMR